MTDLVQRLRLPKSATGYISRETLMAERLVAADEIEFLRRALDAALAEIRALTPSPKKQRVGDAKVTKDIQRTERVKEKRHDQ